MELLPLIAQFNEFIIFQETHILHEFENDFYGSELKVIVMGYTRPERDFPSVGKYDNYFYDLH